MYKVLDLKNGEFIKTMRYVVHKTAVSYKEVDIEWQFKSHAQSFVHTYAIIHRDNPCYYEIVNV
jgi:hypothetical protein